MTKIWSDEVPGYYMAYDTLVYYTNMITPELYAILLRAKHFHKIGKIGASICIIWPTRKSMDFYSFHFCRTCMFELFDTDNIKLDIGKEPIYCEPNRFELMYDYRLIHPLDEDGFSELNVLIRWVKTALDAVKRLAISLHLMRR